MNSVYLLTGSNAGDRAMMLEQCRIQLEPIGHILHASDLYETEAWGLEGLPPHLNQALHLHTAMTALALLDAIHVIENSLGRERQQRWGVRSIDIDIIFFNDEVYNLPQLIVPHPLMQQRNFVLTPLAEIAGGYHHPILATTVSALKEACTDTLAVRKWKNTTIVPEA